MPKMYEFSVNLDDKYVRVVASDKFSASKQGAIALGVVWRERARDMIIIQGREIRRKELEKQNRAQETGKHGIAPSQSPAATALPQGGRAKGAAAPTPHPSPVVTPSPQGEGLSRRKSAVPTYKTGPLAGMPMRTTKKGGR